MNLRGRLTLGIVLLVLTAVVSMWLVAGGGILRPFATRVFEAFLDQAVYVADRVEEGDDPHLLGERLGLDVRFVPAWRVREVLLTWGEGTLPEELEALRDRDVRRPPAASPRVRGKGPGRGRGRPGIAPDDLEDVSLVDADELADAEALPEQLTVIRHEGRVMAFPPGPRDRILVGTDQGWLLIRRDLELDQPRRQLGIFLPVIAFVLILVASALASAATRPLTTAREGMERIADGDLDHRLEEGGPEEIARVAVAFNRMADRIDGLLRTERELMAGLSHELRTPLTRLRLEMEMLRDAGAPAGRLDAMEGDVTAVDGLIEELLHLSRLQLGDHRIDPVTVDLAELSRRAVEAAPLPHHEVSILGPGGQVRGDQTLLLRVLVNLLQNAGRYAPKQSRVWITAEAPRLTVEDEGPGVPDEELAMLFSPFWRARSAEAKAARGLGLGLMFVRQVVTLHGGDVRAENRAEGGLRVVIELGKPGALAVSGSDDAVS